MTDNVKPVEIFIQEIKDALENQTTNWRTIAKCFAEASEHYGAQSDSFKKILKKTAFSGSTASKLVAVNNSKKANHEAFKRTPSWTVLYDITKLEDEQFDKLLDNLKWNDCDAFGIVTGSDVSKVLPKAPVDPYKTVLEIKINDPAMRTGRFDGEDYKALQTAMQDLLQKVRFLRVDEKEAYDSVSSPYWKSVKEEVLAVNTEKALEAIQAWVESEGSELVSGDAPVDQYDVPIGAHLTDGSHVRAYKDLSEVKEALKGRADEFFEVMSDWYDKPDQAVIWDNARATVDQKREKLIKNLPEPFANTAIETSKKEAA